MNKIYPLLLILCVVLSAGQLSAWEANNPEIQGGREFIGNFDGFEYEAHQKVAIYIRLSETGYRVSLPLAEDVEYLFKPNGYLPYNPEKFIFLATIKAIVLDNKAVQIIVLEVPS